MGSVRIAMCNKVEDGGPLRRTLDLAKYESGVPLMHYVRFVARRDSYVGLRTARICLDRVRGVVH